MFAHWAKKNNTDRYSNTVIEYLSNIIIIIYRMFIEAVIE